MVAVFTGNGLGLFNSSIAQLGGSSGGSGGIGQSRERGYVNLATGNLLLQDMDESLVVRGLSATLLRTYNSRGSVTGQGQDGWVTGFERNVVLGTGTFNQSGSTVFLNLGDGTSQEFKWVSANVFQATGGDGAHDTLTYNAAATPKTWTYVEGSTRREETYADHADTTLKGRLTRIRDLKTDGTTPAQYDIAYNADNRISEVRSFEGTGVTTTDAIVFSYNEIGQLTAIKTRENGTGTIKTQVSYSYDIAGRLEWVQTDLTPDSDGDNTWDDTTAANNTGKRFRTTYSYVVPAVASPPTSDLRIASVTTSDGATVAYTYESDGAGGYRVKTATQGHASDGSAHTTTFTYNANSTDVSDGVRTWTYQYDANKQLTAVLEPAVNGLRQKTTYAYDTAGNLVRISQASDANNAATTVLLDTVYKYDTQGNRVLQRDRLGNTVEWTYSSANQVTSEKRYTTADADGLDPNHTGTTNLPSGLMTTTYVYDTRNRVRYVVNAVGEVREFTYATSGNGIGQVASERRYFGETYTGTINLTNLDAWATNATAKRKSNSGLIAYTYDAKGRLSQTVEYAAVANDANGAGVLDTASAITNFTYDAQGLLRQKVAVRGATRSLSATPNESEVTHYVYDGMGRLLGVLTRDSGTAAVSPDAVADPNGAALWDAATVLTTYAYVDHENKVVVTLDSGAIRTEARDKSGQLLWSKTEGMVSGINVARTTYSYYDASGRLRASQDAAGARTYYFYDNDGRISAVVDATGTVTETRYDGIGRIAQTITYAIATDTSAWLSGNTVVKDALVFAATAPALTANQAWVQTDATRDRATQRTYDNAGRLATEIQVGADNAQTQRTTYTYDAANRLTQVVVSDGAGTTATARTTRFLYDAADRQIAMVDAAGYVTESVYDPAGRLTKTIRYWNASANPAATTLTGVRPTTLSATNDQTTRYFYDARGDQVGVLDAESYLTEYVYDEAANLRAERRYAKKLTGLTGSETFAALRTQAQASGGKFVETRSNYNGLGQLTATIVYAERDTSVTTPTETSATTYLYDEAGRLIRTRSAATSSETTAVRDGYRRLNVFGEAMATLSGEQVARALSALGIADFAAASAAQQDIAYATYGTTYGYDALGRLIETTGPKGSASEGDKTWYFYDAYGRTTHVVRGIADPISGVPNQYAEVTETRYTAFGEVRESLTYTSDSGASARLKLSAAGSRSAAATMIDALKAASLDPADTRVQYSYNLRGLLASRIDALGYTATFAYNAFGERTGETQALINSGSRTNTIARDNRGLVTQTIEDAGSGKLNRTSSTAYDAFGRAISLTDARGNVATYGYDRLGRQLTQSRTVGGRTESTQIAYDAYSRVVTTTDALGAATNYVYDTAARTVTVTSPEGVVVTTTRNAFGEVTRIRDAANNETVNTYNKDGQLIGVQRPGIATSEAMAYDVRGFLIETTDRTGRKVGYTYDAVGRVLSRIEDPAGLALTTRYAYDSQGRQIKVTDASGRVTTMTYDAKGQLTQTAQDPSGLNLRTTYVYDTEGRTVTVREGVDGSNALRTTQYVFDALGRRVQEIQAAGSLNLTTVYAYDGNDNVVTRTDATGRVTRYAYDAANRLRYSVDGAGGVVETAYDVNGRATMTRAYAKPADMTGQATVLSEATLETLVGTGGQNLANDALDDATYRVYDRDGRMRLNVDGAGGVRETVYDALGRVLRETRYAQAVTLTATLRGTLKAGTATVANVGAVASAIDENVRHVYDAMGRLRYSVDATGAVSGLWYDAASRVVATRQFATRLGLAVVTDAITQAQIESAMGSGAATDAVELFVYDGAGRARYSLRANGDAGTYPITVAVTETRYDGAGRALGTWRYAPSMTVDLTLAVQLSQGTASESPFATFAATNAASAQSERKVYDAAGRMQYTIDGTGAYVRYRYDAASRLIALREAVTRLNPAAIGDATTAAQVESMVVSADADALTMYTYDAAGRLRYTVKAVGSAMVRPVSTQVAETQYDAAGRVLNTRGFVAHFMADEAMMQKFAVGSAADADFASFVAANAATAQSQRTVYDGAGRAVYTIDAIGAFVRTWYDGIGRATAVRRFATPFNPATLNDTTTVAQLDTLLVFTLQDIGTAYSAYDAAGRLRYSVMMTSPSTAQVIEQKYDGTGRLSLRRAYSALFAIDSAIAAKLVAGISTDADFATFAAANESTARLQYQIYDASGRVRYVVARSGAGVGTVSGREYDGVGRVVKDHRYDVPVPENPTQSVSDVDTALQAAFSADPAVRATQQRTTQYVYDAAGQQRFVLDATGALSEQRFDGVGRVTETRSYGNRPTGIAANAVALATWTQGQATADVRKATNAYDAAGHLTARTDALNHSESFVYDGAGRLLTRTDRMGAVWTYQYDAAGRKTAEISPLSDVFGIDAQGALTASNRAIVTRYAYDALGQLLSKTEDADSGNAANARITQFEYDSRGHLVRTVLPHPGEIDQATGNLVFNGSAPTIETTYNALGQVVVLKDERGNHRYSVYDALGRVVAEVDQEKAVTTYEYNAFGEQTRLLRYAAALNTAATAFTSANWQAGQAIGWTQIAAGVDNGNTANRAIYTAYDALGRKTQITLPAVAYHRQDGTQSSGSPVTQYVYNAYGETVKESVLLEGTAGQPDAVWADTWRYYDAAGRNTFTIDAGNYATSIEYNANGDAVRTVEYARALSGVALTTALPPTAPAAGDATIGYDREMRWTYDALGRKASETAVRNYVKTDNSSARVDMVTTFGYDHEDRVTTKTDNTGTITTTYNALGQAIAVREPVRGVLAGDADTQLLNAANTLQSASLTVQRSPYTTMAYDGLGRLIAARRHANGHDGVNTPDISVDDQVTLTFYDKRDRALMSQDALGNKSWSAYDGSGNLTHRWQSLVAGSVQAHQWYVYDKTGRQTETKATRVAISNGATLGTDQLEAVQYNAFGEIVVKTFGSAATGTQLVGSLTYTYDSAGRLIGNDEGGASRNFGYNLAGHQVREWHSIKTSATATSITVVTAQKTDKLGRAVRTTLPSHTADPNLVTVMRQTYDRWGNVLQVVDARGYQTDYQYNDFNQLVKETRPLVWVVGENGGGTWQRPVNQWYYGAAGRLRGTRDANGNLRLYDYDAVGNLTAVTDGTGAVTRHAYDVLNHQRMTQDALGYITFKTYDQGDRITSIGDFLANGTARARTTTQSYGYNAMGDRASVTDALSNTATYTFDSQHRLLGSLTAAGVAMNYGYDVRGNKILETNALTGTAGTVSDRDGGTATVHAQTWKYDAYGRLTDHNTLSGRDFNYVYDSASGLLLEESQSGGSGMAATDGVRTFEYFPNGRVKKITEAGGGTYRYEYDAAGNRTYEWATTVDLYGVTVNLVTRTVYDSNNRVQRATQDEVDAAGNFTKRIFDLTYDYDANGNRRRVLTQSGFGVNVTGITVVNDAPAVVAPVADRGVRPGQTTEFRLLFTDVFRDAQNDALTLTITQQNGSALPSWLVASRDAQTGEIVFVATVPTGAANDDLVVKLTVSETANPTNTTSTTFTVKVRANNLPTATATPASFNAVLGNAFGRDVLASEHFADIDVGETLALSVVGALPSWLTADTSAPGRLRLSGTPTTQGTYALTVRATDSRGATVDKTVTVVAAPNAGPTVVAAPGPQDATLNHSFTWVRNLSQVFADANGEPLQVAVTGLPSWLSYQMVTSTTGQPQLRISGEVPPTATLNQVFTVQLTATDPNGASASTSFTITVSTNVAPFASTVDNKLIKQNLAYATTLPEFYDDNGDALTYTATGLPPGLSFNAATRQITGTPTTAGSWGVTYSAYDGRVTTSTTFTLTVEANNPPQAPSLGAQSWTRTVPVNWTLPAFTDPNGDPLTYTLTGLPAGLSFNASTRTVTGTPTTASSGTATYTANDGRGGVVSTTFAWTVSNPAGNQKPVVTNGLIDQTIDAGTSTPYQFASNTFTDPEGQTLTYSYSVIAGGPASWVSFAPSTRTFTFAPGAFVDTTITLRVTATDTGGLSEYDDFTVTVIPSGGQFAAPGGEETLSFEMGMQAQTANGPLSPQMREQWFTYDAENRVKISNGVLSGTAGQAGTTIQLTLPTTQSASYENAYDAQGRLVAQYALIAVNGSTYTRVDRTAYDQRGNRQYEYYTELLGFATGGYEGIRTQYTYDAANRMVESRGYYELSAMRETDYAPEGTPELRSIGGWLRTSAQVRYDADGRVRWQMGYHRPDDLATVQFVYSPTQLTRQFTDTTVLSLEGQTEYTYADATPGTLDDNASAYDAAGRLLRYRYTGKGSDGSWYTHTFDSTYRGDESYQEVTVSGTSSNTNYKPTTNTLSYDAYGRLVSQSEDTQYDTYIPNRIRLYTYNAEGQVVTRRHGTWENNAFKLGDADPNGGALPVYGYVYAAGQQLAQLQDGGQVREGQTTSIQRAAGGGTYSAGGGTVVAQSGETLRSLAKRVYGNEQLWYVIADANGLVDANADLTDGVQLKAPGVQVNTNDANTFQPYDPSEAIGSTSPSLPYIPKPEGCDAFMMVMIAVVAIAVSIASYGAMTGQAWATVAGVASTATVTTGTIVAAGAVAGAAGAFAGQALGSFTGVSSFSWRNVAAGAITGAITAGIGTQWGSVATALSEGSVMAAAGLALANAGAGYVGQKIAGVPNTHFSWKRIAAAAVGNLVGTAIAPSLTGGIDSAGLQDFMTGAIGGATNYAVRKAFGFKDDNEFANVLIDTIGGMIGAGAERASRRANEAKAATGAHEGVHAGAVADQSEYAGIEGHRENGKLSFNRYIDQPMENDGGYSGDDSSNGSSLNWRQDSDGHITLVSEISDKDFDQMEGRLVAGGMSRANARKQVDTLRDYQEAVKARVSSQEDWESGTRIRSNRDSLPATHGRGVGEQQALRDYGVIEHIYVSGIKTVQLDPVEPLQFQMPSLQIAPIAARFESSGRSLLGKLGDFLGSREVFRLASPDPNRFNNAANAARINSPWMALVNPGQYVMDNVAPAVWNHVAPKYNDWRRQGWQQYTQTGIGQTAIGQRLAGGAPTPLPMWNRTAIISSFAPGVQEWVDDGYTLPKNPMRASEGFSYATWNMVSGIASSVNSMSPTSQINYVATGERYTLPTIELGPEHLLGGATLGGALWASNFVGVGEFTGAANAARTARELSVLRNADSVVASSGKYLDSTTPAGATVHHGKYSTAIGDDASIIDNFQVATDTGQGHNVIVHGHRPGYDDFGGVFVVNDQATHTQQIADALMSNPNYKPGCSVFLASCWSGSNGTARELANIINARVTAPTIPVSFNELMGQWEMLSDLGMSIKYPDLVHVKPEFRTFDPVKK